MPSHTHGPADQSAAVPEPSGPLQSAVWGQDNSTTSQSGFEHTRVPKLPEEILRSATSGAKGLQTALRRPETAPGVHSTSQVCVGVRRGLGGCTRSRQSQPGPFEPMFAETENFVSSQGFLV